MEELQQENALLKAENEALKAEIEALKLQVKNLAHKSSSKKRDSPKRERGESPSMVEMKEALPASIVANVSNNRDGSVVSLPLPLPPTPKESSETVLPEQARVNLSARPSRRGNGLVIGRSTGSNPALGKQSNGRSSNPEPPPRPSSDPSTGEMSASPRREFSLDMLKNVPPHYELTPRSMNAEELNRKLVEDICDIATIGNMPNLIKLLAQIKSPALVNRLNDQGQTIIYCAAKSGQPEIIVELLNSCPQMDLNIAVLEAEKTPLHVACFSGYGEVVALLLTAGANPNLRNKHGLVPQQEAIGSAIDVFNIIEEEGFEGLASKYPRVLELQNRPLEAERKARASQESSSPTLESPVEKLSKKKNWKLTSGDNVIRKKEKDKDTQGIRKMEGEENNFVLYSMHGSGALIKKSSKISFVNFNKDASTPFSSLAQKFSDVTLKCILNLYKVVNYYDMLGRMAQNEQDVKWLQTRAVASQKMQTEFNESVKNVISELNQTILRINSVNAEKDSALEKVLLRVNDLLASGLTPDAPALEEKVVQVGRYLQLMRSSVIAALQQKATILFFTTSQILTDFVDITLENVSVVLHFLALVQSFLQIMRNIHNNFELLCQIETVVVDQARTPGTKKYEREKRPRTAFEKNCDPQQDLTSPASLSELIFRLLNQPKDCEFADIFHMTCSRFASAATIIQKLTSKWQFVLGSKSSLAEPICISLLIYAQRNFFMMTLQDVVSVQEFLESVQYEGPTAKLLKDELARNDLFGLPASSSRIIPSTIPVFAGVTSPSKSISSFDLKDVSEQLTLIEHEVYKNITPIELLDQAWSKPEKQPLAQNVIFMLERANRISYWVATSILLQRQLKDRTKVLRKFISLGKHLLSLRNYNSLMGVVVGLNMGSISRLKHTFAALPARSHEILKQCVDIMSPSGSFKILREAMEATLSLQENGCVIPYVGTTCSDLTFIEENPSIIQTEKGNLINFPKHKMVYTGIHNLLRYQKFQNTFQHKEPLFTFLSELPVLDNSELFQISLEVEPRESRA